MTIDIRAVVDTYHTQYNLATTDEERQQLSVAHQSFIDQLLPDQQQQARDAARPYLLTAVAMAETMEPVLQRAKEMLNHRREPV